MYSHVLQASDAGCQEVTDSIDSKLEISPGVNKGKYEGKQGSERRRRSARSVYSIQIIDLMLTSVPSAGSHLWWP